MFADHVARQIVQALTTSAAVAVLGLSPLGARAAEDAKHQDHMMGKGPGSMAQLMKMSPEECMQMMDKEHKGHVTKKDFMKFQEDLWKKMDKDKNGKVTAAEFTDAG
jgi:ABC-type Fe3+-citrate transport system substrate-binding protein